MKVRQDENDDCINAKANFKFKISTHSPHQLKCGLDLLLQPLHNVQLTLCYNIVNDSHDKFKLNESSDMIYLEKIIIITITKIKGKFRTQYSSAVMKALQFHAVMPGSHLTLTTATSVPVVLILTLPSFCKTITAVQPPITKYVLFYLAYSLKCSFPMKMLLLN